jgi:AraC family transcriptional regulator, L-rhamnose operon regulatory protein RhaS
MAAVLASTIDDFSRKLLLETFFIGMSDSTVNESKVGGCGKVFLVKIHHFFVLCLFMKRFNQYETFNFNRFELAEWPYPLHNHNHFEIIFIHHGTGIHHINENRFPYEAGDVFLLGLEDSHTFDIHTSTRFCYLRFTGLFFQNQSLEWKDKQWQQTIEYLFHGPYQSSGSIVKDADEKKRLDHLLTVLLDEYDNRKKQFAEQIVDYLMRAIVSILARNISLQNLHLHNSSTPHIRSQQLEDILLYIHQHIHSPKKLRIEQMSAHFQYSANYLSIFFKRQTGESLQQYILRYKLKMVETRLRYSDRSISQIAFEFGFSDESHLSKLFKKYYQLTPGDFRKSVEKIL